MSERSSIIIPSDKDFMKNKEVSDRVYVWFLLNGEYRGDGTYMKKWGNKGATTTGLNSRTFNKKMNKLLELRYIEDCGEEYRIKFNNQAYKRYLYRDTAEKLLSKKKDYLIKIYMWLGSYYDSYGDRAYFTYSGLLKGIGLSYLHNSRNGEKAQRLIDNLVEMGLLECERVESETRYDRYRIKEVKK